MAAAELRSFSAMVFSVCAIIRYDSPSRLRITVTSAARMRAEPSSPRRRPVSVRGAFVCGVMRVPMVLMAPPLRARHDRHVREDAELAGPGHGRGVMEGVLDGDQLAGPGGVHQLAVESEHDVHLARAAGSVRRPGEDQREEAVAGRGGWLRGV